MLALCSMLLVTYYAQNYAGIIGWSLPVIDLCLFIVYWTAHQYMHVVFLYHFQCPTGKTAFQEARIYNNIASRCVFIIYLLCKYTCYALKEESDWRDNQSH